MMDSDFYITLFSIMVPIWFGIFAVFFFVIGLRGILTKRPFLISSRWLLLVMFIGLVPAILIPVFLPGDSSFIIKWLNPAIFTLLLVMMCFALRGYVAYAVTDTSFRDALLTSLQKLDLPYEETLSTIRLTSVEVDLQVSIQSWMGSGQIKIKQRGHSSLLKKIADAMNEHFRVSSADTNLTACIFFLVMGILMVIGGIAMSLLFQRIL
ncbi:MAG: hypothetical protein OXH39_24020 [Candidatus Poribacteria bacterium]|nr:hypothetical protein [Candidatus Poribacteria bacterium]